MKNAYKKEFGKVLKTLRKENDYPSRDLFAEELGEKGGTYGAWEEGRALPNIKTFQKICKLLKITPDQFLAKINAE